MMDLSSQERSTPSLATTYQLKVATQNIRGVNSKLQLIYPIIQRHNLDLLILTETHLSKKTTLPRIADF